MYILYTGLSGQMCGPPNCVRRLFGYVARPSVDVFVLPTLCVDGLKWSDRVCAGCGGSGTNFGNLVRKMRLSATDPDCLPSCADDLVVRRSVDLPSICIGDYGCLGYVFIGIP
jgi:hypothetical protein